MTEYFNLSVMFYTPDRSGEAFAKVPLASEQKAKEIVAAGFSFEGELHPNPAIGVTTTITHEEMGDVAIVTSRNTKDWEGHAVKVGDMIEKFEHVKTYDNWASSQEETLPTQ